MEDVLDVYERPYDPMRPVVCIDEKSKQLLGTPNGSIPAKPGKPERIDSEYKRNGTANIFGWTEPLTGRRNADVTERRTAVDFAEQLKELTDVEYPDAEKLVLVCDNLNTHSPASLYERYDPAEAHRIANKIEWHHTPEHGSWLNMAEIELSILSRQCLNRRIADIDMLRSEVAAYNQQRNSMPVKIDWQFTTADARTKLKRLYPVSLQNQLN
jgi:hypothetical protein